MVVFTLISLHALNGPFSCYLSILFEHDVAFSQSQQGCFLRKQRRYLPDGLHGLQERWAGKKGCQVPALPLASSRASFSLLLSLLEPAWVESLGRVPGPCSPSTRAWVEKGVGDSAHGTNEGWMCPHKALTRDTLTPLYLPPSLHLARRALCFGLCARITAVKTGV